MQCLDALGRQIAENDTVKHKYRPVTGRIFTLAPHVAAIRHADARARRDVGATMQAIRSRIGNVLAARGQTTNKIARIGFLCSAIAAGSSQSVKALREGLNALGYVEGKNIVIEF